MATKEEGRRPLDWSGWMLVLTPVLLGSLQTQAYRSRADAWMTATVFMALFVVVQVAVLGVDSHVLAKRGQSAGGYASCGVLALSLVFWPLVLVIYLAYLRGRDREGLPRKLALGVVAVVVLLGCTVYGSLVFDKAEVRCEVVAKGVDVVCETHNPTPGAARSCFRVDLVSDARNEEVLAGSVCAEWLGWGDTERGSILSQDAYGAHVIEQMRTLCFPISGGTDPTEAPACSVRVTKLNQK